MSPTVGWLARDLVSVALALPVALLWIRVIVPVLVRPFGIPIRPSFAGGREWREALPPLSNVLVFGVLIVPQADFSALIYCASSSSANR